jgi:hypothetical protein
VTKFRKSNAVAFTLCMLAGGCQAPQRAVQPVIEFSKLPPSGSGSPDKLQTIEGRVAGSIPADRIVLFARSGPWWVQPTAAEPYTEIADQGRWKTVTHPGSAYAALLVKHEYRPQAIVEKLPKPGGNVLAVAIAEGAMLENVRPRTIHFSGYEWELHDFSSDRAGSRNVFDSANTWTDNRGLLHLRISRKENEWKCADVRLSRSLGYGSYRFTVRDVSMLEPAAVFSIFTWEESAPSHEMDIELTRWGELAGKNSQYVVQPYYVPANVIRFIAPAGVLTHLFQWGSGRVSFRTVRGSEIRLDAEIVDEHTFTMGVPSPGNECVRMSLYQFVNDTNPLRKECEVIVEKFEYLP